MDIFVWNESYMTGEAQVDSEHQELVRIINWVIEHQNMAEGTAGIETLLDRLVNYAVVHFGHEEALMAASGCDPRFIAAHVKVHRDFADQVTKMREFPIGGGDMEYLLRFLSSWLAQHILGIDQSMGRQIRAIRRGTPATKAFEEEQAVVRDPGTVNLLEAMNALFRLIAARNEALEKLNSSLEAQVVSRTQALTQTNQQLVVEQGRLQLAMKQLEMTQKKLLESEHRRSEATKRNMEKLLVQIIDGDPVPTFVINSKHEITHWNRACALISGLDASVMVGTSDHWKAFYPEKRPLLADLIVDGAMDSEFKHHYRYGVRHSPIVPGAYEGERNFPEMGQGRWLAFTAAPLYDEVGAMVGAIETLQDVTDRHAAEEALLRQQNQLELQVAERTSQLATANVKLESDRRELEQLLSKIEEAQQQLLQSEKMAAIGQLAAGVAHEINNPIGFVSSNLGTLKTYIARLINVVDAYATVLAGGGREMLDQALRDADLEFLCEDLPALLAESQEGLGRVTKIVQDLKDFSRVDQAERQLADLNAALESTLNVVWNELKYKADVVRELGDIPEVDCVPAQINQVFMNLLVNAAQAIEQHGRITVRSGSEKGHVWFEIADTGKGMAPEVCNRIFEPFFTTKPVGKGTGLGLSISYDIIVKKHGGRFDVTSTPGQGSSFRIWLPVTGGSKQPGEA